ncbi:Transcriptional regulator, TetR family [Arthrobacter sp. PAMC 25486]|nr:Transcriptional regulator, TetR family [Arthrobacter sp. PAMC 25486]
MADILSIGRSHLALHGAAGLSLRAVARDLGVVSSAVYRYVKNRDELLTLLVVDGYTALGEAVDLAVGSVAADDFPGQFRALGRAVREWALAEPARYGLLFGSPVPGYEAPAEQTTGPGTRVVVQLVRILDEAHGAGKLDAQDAGGIPQGLALDLAAIRAEMGLSVPEAVVARGVLLWAALFGAVNFEVFGQYGTSTFSEPADLFELHLAALEQTVGLRGA